jgi:hypothetical protein
MYILFAFLIAGIAYAQQPPLPQIMQPALPPSPKNITIPITPGATFNFNVYVNNSQDTKSNNSTTLTSTQVEKRTETSPLFKKLAELSPDLQGIKNQIQIKTDFFENYKWHLIGASLALSYASLCYFIIVGNSYLGNKDLWSSWHQELSLEQLLAIPQQQLSQDLLHEIQRRYTDPSSLSDLNKPLAQFLTTIEQEEQDIRWYQSFYSWLSFAYITKIIPFSKQRFAKINERLQRLAYYKNIFQSWAAQYQLEHAARCAFHAILATNKNVNAAAHMMHEAHITNCMIETI